MLDLLPLADSVTKLTAHCKFCSQVGALASACEACPQGTPVYCGRCTCHPAMQLTAPAGFQSAPCAAPPQLAKPSLPPGLGLQEQRRVAAVFSLRIAADSRQELVGGADVYAPVCRRHYVELSSVRQQEEGGKNSGAAGSGSSGRNSNSEQQAA